MCDRRSKVQITLHTLGLTAHALPRDHSHLSQRAPAQSLIQQNGLVLRNEEMKVRDSVTVLWSF